MIPPKKVSRMSRRGMRFAALIICCTLLMIASGISEAAYSDQVFKVQKKLSELGYNPGPVDGLWGKKTKKALEQFQHDNGLPVTGKLDWKTIDKLDSQRKRQKQTIHKTVSTATRGLKVIATQAKGQPQQVQLYDYTSALIIGIDQYYSLTPGEQLSYAVKDAKGMENVLRNSFQFDEIVTLYNEQATRDKIMQELYGFRSLSPDAGVFVYFAGHGITMSAMVGEKDLGYLVPYDGSLNSSEMYKNISMQQLKSDICVSITAKHVFFVFDACFAGLMLDTRATLVKPSRDFSYLKAITKEQVRQVLTAGEKGQTVLDGGPGGHSVFTGRLIQALENLEDYITARELGQYLKKRVYADAAARGHIQRPVDGEIYGTGDFVFVADVDRKLQEADAKIQALEAELEELAKQEEIAKRLKGEADTREIERQRLLKEAALKQAKLRQEAAARETEYKRKAEQNERLKALSVDRQEKEREKRLAALRNQAETMRERLKESTTVFLNVKDASDEVKDINRALENIENKKNELIKKSMRAVDAYYKKQIKEAKKVEPWDKMFETQDDFQKRVETSRKRVNDLISELELKKKEETAKILSEIEQQLGGHRERLYVQRKMVCQQRFPVPIGSIIWSFDKYDPKRNEFKVSIKISLENEQEFSSTACSPIPRELAKQYYKHPDILTYFPRIENAIFFDFNTR